MLDSLATALARLKHFRASWEDNGLIDADSGLTTEDLDVAIQHTEATGDLVEVAYPEMG